MKRVYSLLVCILLLVSLLGFSELVIASGEPTWRNQGQSKTSIESGESIVLYAQGRDNVALDWAWLATNETGGWQSFDGSWWDYNWDYYKSLAIDTPSEDFQMSLVIYKEEGHDDFENGIVDCEGHCNVDFSDIRFVDSDQTTLLPYWIEEIDIDDGDHYARVWVKTAGEETIYLYYGNSAAVSASDGTDTFIMFEDMSSDCDDKWYRTDSEDGKKHYYCRSIDQTLTGARLRWKAKCHSQDSISWGGYVSSGMTDTNGTSALQNNYTRICSTYNWDNSASETSPAFRFYTSNGLDAENSGGWWRAISEGNTYLWEMKFNVSVSSLDVWNLTGSKKYSSTLFNYPPHQVMYHFFQHHDHNMSCGEEVKWYAGSPNYLRSYCEGSNSGCDAHVEYHYYWMFIANYVDIEPSWDGFGSEHDVDSITDTYGSPLKMQENGEWQWSNFTWQNPAILGGTTVGWRIYYSDTDGNINYTDILSFSVTDEELPPHTIYVDDDASAEWYNADDHVRTIGEGVNNVTEGGTVFLYSGIYNEKVEIDKKLDLIGENKDTTVINGSSKNDVVKITVNDVTVSGFTLQNSRQGYPASSPPPSAVKIIAKRCTITENNITNNDYGIIIDCASDNIIHGNIILNNDEYGIYIFCFRIPPGSSDNNHIYHNNFIGNTGHASVSGDNQWDYGYPSGGNYWDDYTGVDSDGDGIGDTPYVENGVNDRYPLIDPWNVTPVNNPPYQPEQLEGPTDGYIGVPYTFTANSVIDPDGDDVSCLFDWGDGNQSTWTDYMPSGGDCSVSYTWQIEGKFGIKVKVKDRVGQVSDWSPVLNVTISMLPSLALVIDAPSFVIEEHNFQLTITAGGMHIEDVVIEFLEELYYTDGNGIANLTAPSVEQDTDYTIIARHDDYESATISITVLNQEEQENKGWIYGIVSDTSGNNIKDASVNIQLSEYTSIRHFTNEEGYRIQVPTGAYTVQASKQGYTASTKSEVVVNKNEATEVLFILEELVDYEPQSSSDDESDIIEAVINAGIAAQKISGELNVEPADQTYNITLYTEDLNVEIISIDTDRISFEISAEELPGTIIALRLLDQKDFTDINVEFDGTAIERVGFTEIFSMGDGDEEKYTRILAEGKNGTVMYCLVYIPHFSAHQITISLEEIVEALGGVTAILLYIAISVIVTAVFIIPMLVNIVRRRKTFHK
jgi:hypothetical protein